MPCPRLSRKPTKLIGRAARKHHPETKVDFLLYWAGLTVNVNPGLKVNRSITFP